MKKRFLIGLLFLIFSLVGIIIFVTKKDLSSGLLLISIGFFGLISFLTKELLVRWKRLPKKKDQTLAEKQLPLTTEIIAEPFPNQLTVPEISTTINHVVVDESKLPSFLVNQASLNRYDTYGYLKALEVKHATNHQILKHRPKFIETYQTLKICTISERKFFVSLRSIEKPKYQTIPTNFNHLLLNSNFFINPKKQFTPANSFKFKLNTTATPFKRAPFNLNFVNQFKKQPNFFRKNLI